MEVDGRFLRACSRTCPVVTSTVRGVPQPSVAKWNFDPNPPRLRSKAWAAGSSGCRWTLFPSPGGGTRGAHVGSIDAPKMPVDEAALVQRDVQGLDDLSKDAFPPPLREVVGYGLPGTEAFGQIPPWRPGMWNPKHSIQQPASIAQWPPRAGCSATPLARSAPIARR